MTTTSTPETLFPGISSLGSPLGAEAAKQFDELEQQLRRSRAEPDIERLHRVDGDVGELDFPILEHIIAPDLIVESLTRTRRARFRRWAGARNALALVPLLLTWGFLAWAAFAYRDQLVADPGKVNQPFLLLWEQGFADSAIPPFSVAAAVTCLLLTIVLAMTVVAHRRETQSIGHENTMIALVDSAMLSLRAAVDHRTGSAAPASAEDWALAAQRILNDTQDVLAKAVQQTAELVKANQEITHRAAETLETVHADARTFVKDFAEVTMKTLDGIREENSQFVDRAAEKAIALLQEATVANRNLIVDQMSPLVSDFQSTLADFTAHHETYRDSAVGLAASAGALESSAAVLAGSTKSYTDIARSIDRHLDGVERSQETFIARIDATTTSMKSTADAMIDTAKIMQTDLKRDLQELARTTVDASRSVASVNTSLIAASGALQGSTTTLGTTTSALGGTTSELKSLVGSMNTAATSMHTAARDLKTAVSTIGSARPGRSWWPWS